MPEGAPAQLVARAAAGPESPPRLADVCRRVLLTRIAQAWGRAEALDEDGAIAEFRSPVRALGAALRIQNDLADLNRDLPPERRRLFRIGVAIGGAAAHCARAEPGGICADDGVLAAAAGRLDMESTDLGPLRRRFARAGARRGEHVEGPRVPLQAVDHPGSPPLEPDRGQRAGRRARRRHGDRRAAALTALTAAPRAV